MESSEQPTNLGDVYKLSVDESTQLSETLNDLQTIKYNTIVEGTTQSGEHQETFGAAFRSAYCNIF